MPPFSRGWSTPGSVRHVSSKLSDHMKRTKRPQFKTSPLEDRGKKVVDSPAKRPAKPKYTPDPVLPTKPSLYARLMSRLSPSQRRTIGKTLIYAPFVGLLWLHCPLQVMWINGGSMTPFFNPNDSPELPKTKDKVLVQSLPYPSRKSALADSGTIPSTGLQRGQIVAFRTPRDPHRIAIKRIVGIPGDRVTPLPPFEGSRGVEEPVVVQYNHIWVEGDVEDRQKSIDSNWYGPICQNLVVGKAIALLEPWYKPRKIMIEEHTYPAKEKGRVEENVVRDAMRTPDEVGRSDAFGDGRALRDLATVTGDPDRVVALVQTDAKQRKQAVNFYKGASKEAQKGDPNTVELAKELVGAMEEVLVKAGFDRDNLRAAVESNFELETMELKKEMQEEDPFMQVGSLPTRELPERPEKTVEERLAEEGPAARALRVHLEKQRKERLEGVPNGLDDSDRQLMWKEQDRVMRENAERIKAESARKGAGAGSVSY